MNTKKDSVKIDIRQEITDKIIKMLEAGGSQTTKLWTKSAAKGFPLNGKTGASYQGVNVLILWAEAMEHGYISNVWLTYNQAAEMGAQVKKGEKGTKGVYFEMLKKKGTDEASAEGTDDKGGFFPMCKGFYLFNIEQIDGLPQSFIDKYTLTGPAPFAAIAEAERLIFASGAEITHGGNKAFFSPSKDAICLPEREQFTTPENYYAVALHELTHWTGHVSRLNRNFDKRFADQAYAFEELIAELGAAFVIGNLGFIDATIENHVSYLQAWLTILRNDKTAIFSACKQAWLASDFILSCGQHSNLSVAA